MALVLAAGAAFAEGGGSDTPSSTLTFQFKVNDAWKPLYYFRKGDEGQETCIFNKEGIYNIGPIKLGSNDNGMIPASSTLEDEPEFFLIDKSYCNCAGGKKVEITFKDPSHWFKDGDDTKCDGGPVEFADSNAPITGPTIELPKNMEVDVKGRVVTITYKPAECIKDENGTTDTITDNTDGGVTIASFKLTWIGAQVPAGTYESTMVVEFSVS